MSKKTTTKKTTKAIVAKGESPADGTAEEAPKPNLKFIGVHPVKKFKTESGEVITLPADQSEPFYHEQAGLIVQHLPHYYTTERGCCGK